MTVENSIIHIDDSITRLLEQCGDVPTLRPPAAMYRSDMPGATKSVQRADTGIWSGRTTEYSYGDDVSMIVPESILENRLDPLTPVRTKVASKLRTPKLLVVTNVLNERFERTPDVQGDVRLMTKQTLGIRAVAYTLLSSSRANIPSSIHFSRVDQEDYPSGIFFTGVAAVERPLESMLRTLQATRSMNKNNENQNESLEQLLSEVDESGSLIAVVSDFRDAADPRTTWGREVERIAENNKVIAIEITDPADKVMPLGNVFQVGSRRLTTFGMRRQKVESDYRVLANERSCQIDNALLPSSSTIKLTTTDKLWQQTMFDGLTNLYAQE